MYTVQFFQGFGNPVLAEAKLANLGDAHSWIESMFANWTTGTGVICYRNRMIAIRTR